MGLSIQFLFIALIVGWIIRIPFNYFQVSNIKEVFSRLDKEGELITGAQKDLVRGSCIVAIAIDSNAIIKRVMYMKGFTVFARFKEFKEFNGKTIKEVIDLCPESSKDPFCRAIRKSLMTALEQKSKMND